MREHCSDSGVVYMLMKQSHLRQVLHWHGVGPLPRTESRLQCAPAENKRAPAPPQSQRDQQRYEKRADMVQRRIYTNQHGGGGKWRWQALTWR